MSFAPAAPPADHLIGGRPALDRALRVFGDVRSGEGARVLLLSLNIFVLLVAYYVIKAVREPLILIGGGAELKAYASAAQAVALLLYVPLYGWVASRLPRRQLIVTVVLFFAGCLAIFSAAGAAHVPIGFAFYVWVGIFNFSAIAQFWSFANDLYSKAEGDRLFPVIAIGSTAGAPVGALVVERLFSRHVSPFAIIPIAAALLLVQLALYLVAVRRPGAGAAASPPALDRRGGFSLVFRSRYLLLMAGLVVLLNLVNTTGEYILSKTVVAAASARVAADPGFDAQAFVGRFYAQYLFAVSVLTVLVQALLVSRIVKYLGIAGVLLAMPIVSLGAYGLIAAGATLAVIRLAKVLENSADYSVMNTAKQLLWLPTSREEKYKAKQAIDTFFVRFGDVMAGGLVWLGATRIGLEPAAFAVVNVVFVVAWIGLALLLLGRHARLSGGAAAPG